MTILWADGFDDYDYDASGDAVLGEYESYGDVGLTVAAGSGRRGGAALRMTTNSDYAHKTLASTYAEIFLAVAINPNALGGDLLVLYSGATAQLGLYIEADGSIVAKRGSAASGTVLGSTSAGAVPTGSWTQLQLRAVISDSVGVVQIRLNGSTSYALNLSSQDTNNGGGGTVNGVRLKGDTSVTMLFDDFVIWDTTGSIANSWLGDVRVDTLMPNGNGDSSQFTGSDGNSTDNYALVDAASPNGTDYVQSDTVGHQDLYALGNLSHTPASIYGVVATAAALKDDAGAREMTLECKSSSTTSSSAAKTLTTSRARYTHTFETDPATSAAWTSSGVNAAQVGVEVAS
jgi:hypothetical protein